MRSKWNSGLVLVLLLVIANGVESNAQKTASVDTGKAVVLSDERIAVLVDRYNRSHEIHGYRIQIISASRKDEARKAKSLFASMYQGYKAHEIYQQPFFIIKVGDFLTKLEAENFHRRIRQNFPESFIVPDIIDPYEQYAKEKD